MPHKTQRKWCRTLSDPFLIKWRSERINVAVQMDPKLPEILFIFIFLIKGLSFPSSISEWVFPSFIWCSLSPPNTHTQPQWTPRLRDPSFGPQRSRTNDDIKVALWARPSKCRSAKQVIMSASKISMNKHAYLTKKRKESGTGVNHPNVPKFSEILRLLANLWEMKMNVFDVRLWQGRLMCFYRRNEDAEKKSSAVGARNTWDQVSVNEDQH